MPITPNKAGADAPEGPHLALLADENGSRIPIVPGASLWVVEDAKDSNKVFPLVLKRVSHKQLVFEMHSANGEVTEYRYQLTTAKPLTRAALVRLVQTAQQAKLQK